MKITRTERRALQDRYGKYQYRVTNGEVHYIKKDNNAPYKTYWAFAGFLADASYREQELGL